MTREQEIIQYRKKLQPWNDYHYTPEYDAKRQKSLQDIKQREGQIGFLSFTQNYDAEKEYVTLRETKPNESKHLYEFIFYRLNSIDYYESRIMYIFRNRVEMTYEQFKKALKAKYKLEIPDKRKLILKTKDVAYYAISDKKVFYIGATISVKKAMQSCRELMYNDYVVTSEDIIRHKIQYDYTDIHTYNSTIKSDYHLKPLLKRCGSEDINDFYKFSYDDATYYALKSKVDAFFIEFPNIAQNSYPYKENMEFFTYQV